MLPLRLLLLLVSVCRPVVPRGRRRFGCSGVLPRWLLSVSVDGIDVTLVGAEVVLARVIVAVALLALLWMARGLVRVGLGSLVIVGSDLLLHDLVQLRDGLGFSS